MNLSDIDIITTVKLATPASAMSSNNQRNRYNTTDDAHAPDCQDWTPVTMSKTKPTSTAGSYKDAASSPTTFAKNSASAVVAATTSASKNDDDNAKKTKYVAKATSDAIRTARCEKKLTQKELAQKCNMDASIVSDIERGGNCVYNATHVNKIQSVLGVKIPRA